MQPFALQRPQTAREAVDAVTARQDAAFIAGGTEVLNLLREGQLDRQLLVDLTRADLDTVDDMGTFLRVGATARGLAGLPSVVERLPALAQALVSGASPQVRNMATPGGNLMQRTRCPYYRDAAFPCNRRNPGSGCPAQHGDSRTLAIFGGSPSCIATHPSDLAVALAALDARVITSSRSGPRQLAVEELYPLPEDRPERETALSHGELIIAIEIPFSQRAAGSQYVKVRDRASYTFALVSAAVAIDVRRGRVRSSRVVLGGVAPRPWRSRAAEAALDGRPLSERTVRAAAAAAVAGATTRPDNAYKVPLASAAVARALRQSGGLS